jgi:predicted AlkP superfamily phosphohydrolase/phosphomutase
MGLGLGGNSEGKNQVVLEVFLDRNTHKLLLEYCKQNQFDLATGFVKATERGMKFFRVVYYKEMKQDYSLIKEQAEEYERDNKLLRQLVDENERLRQILKTCLPRGKRKRK